MAALHSQMPILTMRPRCQQIVFRHRRNHAIQSFLKVNLQFKLDVTVKLPNVGAICAIFSCHELTFIRGWKRSKFRDPEPMIQGDRKILIS